MKLFIENMYLRFTGQSYSNMARLFLRLFAGVMFLQFGVRHMINFSDYSQTFPGVLGMTGEASLATLTAIEIICSIFIMLGFLTRLSLLPAIAAMAIAEAYLFVQPDIQSGYLPLMFIGMFVFLLIAGPGKISIDYFISLSILSRRGKDDTESEELEEV